MKHVQCPANWDGVGNSLFLGGGISSCPLWQPQMVDLLAGTELVLINPRREHFDMNDPNATTFQIEWEFDHLSGSRKASARLFWFPSATLCPITLLELGKFMERSDPLFVGVDPEYKRKVDVEVQLRLARPQDCPVYYSLEALADAVIHWSENS